MRKIFEQFNWIYILKGFVRSYIPFMSIDKNSPDKVIFALLPKFSDDGEMFWFKRCVRSSYYAIELGFAYYQYNNYEKIKNNMEDYFNISIMFKGRSVSSICLESEISVILATSLQDILLELINEIIDQNDKDNLHKSVEIINLYRDSRVDSNIKITKTRN